jgi:DNA repair protein SbcD/Mre11
MKLFATADVHLGMKFSTYDEVRESLVDARFEALARCVSVSRESDCDIFAVAGDLFDRQNVSQADIHRAADILAGFEGRALLILPGNHDFLTGIQNRPWNELMRRLESRSVPVVLLAESRPYSLAHFDLPVTVLPGPCTSKHSRTNAVSWIDRNHLGVPDDHTMVGIAHGSIEGMSLDREGNYYPMALRELKESGADIWIIGHTHRPFPDETADNPWLFVPGTPEPDGFDCAHAGGAWIVNFTDSRVDAVRRVETGTYRFIDEPLRVESLADIASTAEDGMGDLTLERLTLMGSVSKEEYEQLPALLAEIRGRRFYFREDLSELEEVISSATVDEEFSPGSFSSRLLLSLLEDGDPQAAQIAYRLIRSFAK